MKALVLLLLIAVVSGSLSGCAGRLGDFTLLSSKQFNLPINTMQKGSRVTGEDCSNRFLFIPVGHVHPNVKTAIDRAIEKEGANALVDAVVEWSYLDLILFSSVCFTMTGTTAKIQ